MSITSDRIRENGFIHGLCDDAADDIDQLEKELTAEQDKVKVLVDALEPFSRLLQEHHNRLPDSQPIYGIGDALITVGDMRKALAAVKEGK